MKKSRVCLRKLFSFMLTIALISSLAAVEVFAQDEAIKESDSGFYYVLADGNQVRLSAASKEKFFKHDGLYFKDLNSNGELDTYEDYQLPVNKRVDDLLSKMTPEEKAGTLIFACIAGKNGSTVTNFEAAVEGFQGDIGSASVISPQHEALTSREVTITVGEAKYCPVPAQIQDLYVTTFIAALTGAPKDQLDLFNHIQGLAEDTRLGIPAVFSGDRSYNTWGGMIDMAHYAFGVAHDEELLYKLVSEYAKESVALGYHQVFHGYGNEIGSWYGDDPNYIAKMAATETRAYEDNGFNSHSKHFIARGGRNAYVNALSPANLIDSWKIGWKAVVDAGTQWVMTNNNVGITPGVQAYMDKDTFDILRKDLGYEGIVCMDWPADISRIMSQTGITSDGVDISTLSAVERYALILNAGVDMFSCYGAIPGTDIEAYPDNSNRALPQLIVEAVNQGLVTPEDFDMHVARVIKNKFDIGIFEDPYRDWDEALELIGSEAYKAEQILPMSNEEINACRREEITKLEEELMVKSTVMLKNDGILPLAKGINVYCDSNNSNIKQADILALGAIGTVVESMDEADVVIAHMTAFDENFDYLVEDANAAGKPIVLIFEGTIGRSGAMAEPYGDQVAVSNAVLLQTYNNTPDHGSSVGAFYRYVTPSVTVSMLFGELSPSGKTVFEIPVKAMDAHFSWGELQMDIGVDSATRLYMAMLAKENPNIAMPNNLGDVLYTTDFGMNYSNPASIEFSMLSVPKTAKSVTSEDSRGRLRTSIVKSNAVQNAGVPFEVCFVAKNNGGTGHIDAQITVDGKVVAEKFVALVEDQFRVITMKVILEAGEHTISLGDMTETIIVQ
jgi:beta-glucosidase